MYDLKVKDTIFESIKHVDENGCEFWYARELQNVLEYKEWRKFNNIINKAINSCENSNNEVSNHFVRLDKMIKLAKGAKRKILDYKLSRYACYLIAQNGDSHIKKVALAQTYFAIQTRKQEIIEEEYNFLSENQKRLNIREKVKEGNFTLNRTALNSGVKNLAEFHNFGYKGLYNGETANDIAKRKCLRYREDILDNMGSDELAANFFRISQTNQELKKKNKKDENKANNIHYNVAKDIRNFIKKHGGIMPEDLPTPSKSLKELEKEGEKKLKY